MNKKTESHQKKTDGNNNLKIPGLNIGEQCCSHHLFILDKRPAGIRKQNTDKYRKQIGYQLTEFFSSLKEQVE